MPQHRPEQKCQRDSGRRVAEVASHKGWSNRHDVRALEAAIAPQDELDDRRQGPLAAVRRAPNVATTATMTVNPKRTEAPGCDSAAGTVRGTALFDSEVLFGEKLDVEKRLGKIEKAFVFQLGGGAKTTGLRTRRLFLCPLLPVLPPDAAQSRRSPGAAASQITARPAITFTLREPRVGSRSVTENHGPRRIWPDC